MSARWKELVATDEPTIVSEPLFDAIVVEDGQSDRGFPNPPCTNESNWSEGFCEVNNLLDQLVASETCSSRWEWGFSRHARCRYKILGQLAAEIADLTRV